VVYFGLGLSVHSNPATWRRDNEFLALKLFIVITAPLFRFHEQNSGAVLFSAGPGEPRFMSKYWFFLKNFRLSSPAWGGENSS
jgi:hypothetical protein